ncbi:sugar phosphate isomerase/epimerase family protein [Chondrinema litorale]|uniref:sugar phosphate isomerase/epimerase family protein n=1 Tax=Chondrinema litorale TaxID=2994555 RepID=UPI0025430614|nr:sugar phosphate isomerase/epimerase family protein [Chondrinema litorale]UZR99401.1 sugar phosphate isomerase/epimerase [Chondrinema litorale]
MNRRNFIKSTTLAAATINLPFTGFTQDTSLKRKFKLCLSPGNIGVSLDQKGALQAAIDYGYEAIVSFPNEIQNWSDDEVASFKKEMKSNKIAWGSGGIPVEFRKDEQTFKDGLSKLAKAAEALQKVGASKMNTWIMPTHPTLSYSENMKQHASRLGECAKILADYDVKLGLEYVGPKTLMARDRYPFIHTLAECLTLIENTKQPNVGIQLDTFHWYCGEDTVADLLSLKPSQIITVDLNDARSDLSRDAQLDGTRELAGATGVIDITAFLKALMEIGYDGTVRSEPFNKKLNDMDDKKAMELDMQSLQAVLKNCGVK